MPVFKLQTYQGGLRLYFEKRQKNCRGRQCCQNSKQRGKTVTSPLVSHPWGQDGCQRKQKTSENSNFWVLAAVFWPWPTDSFEFVANLAGGPTRTGGP